MFKNLFAVSVFLISTIAGAAEAQNVTTPPAEGSSRRFGFSLGSGFELANGNRGHLWNNDFTPSFDVRAQYQFDFPMTLELGFSRAMHSYDTAEMNLGHVNVAMNYLYADAKYKIGPSWVPSFIFGFGQATKDERSASAGSDSKDDAFMMNVGVSWNIPVAERISLVPEWRYRFAQFSDQGTTMYQFMGLDDLSGGFSSYTVSLLSTF